MSREERVQTRLAMTMADDRQADFGTFLRQARERSGLSLQELAVTTKISARVLEALERNDPSKLPGGIFSRAFVRTYAKEVGVDADAAVARFVAAFPDESGADEMPATTRAVEAESFEQRRRFLRLAMRLIGVALLVAFLAFVYYARLRPGAAGNARPVTEPPATAVPAPRTAEPAPPASQEAVAPGGSPAEAPSTAAVPPQEPAQGAAPRVEPPAAALTATAAANPGGQDAQAAQPAPAAAPLVVVLTFSDPCWISVSVDGTRVPSRTAGAGERLEFAVQRSITLNVGNAGAVSVALNGKPARPLGGPGQVVTTTITVAAYESFLR